MPRRRSFADAPPRFELDSRSGTWVPIKASPRPARRTADQAGFLYLLGHESGRMVKIGMTVRDPEARLARYVATHGLKGVWHIEDVWRTADARRVERAVHAALAPYRFSARTREVFACSPSEAAAVIRAALRDA